MLNQLYPVLFMLASTFSLSLTGLFTKYLGQYFEPSLLSFLRFIVPSFIILVITRKLFTRPPGAIDKMIWIRAFCIAVCQVCFIYSLNHLSLVESVVLFGTGPLFLPMLERLIFSTPLNWISVWGLMLTFSGVILLAGDVSGVNLRVELLVGLASGLFNAGSQLSLHRISRSDMGAFEINYWTFLYAAIVLSPYVGYRFFTTEQMVDTHGSTPLLLTVVIFGVSFLIINTQVFRAKAYRLVESGSQLAPLIFTNLMFTTLWQWLFYAQSYSFSQLTGLAFIVLANMFVVFAPIVSTWLREPSLNQRSS
ncbi:DMT family transporter [Vibrio sp. VPAP30]|uniref:DMT family transporter n=1 Tax=Vibrio sp. VPAP30 TaxID=1647102 RepID=UPI000658801A|nr:DMT family transporter [Vibrio sp. VPAP30]KLN65070.1 membrane protein [Vibrio sp. VPAP30]